MNTATFIYASALEADKNYSKFLFDFQILGPQSCWVL